MAVSSNTDAAVAAGIPTVKFGKPKADPAVVGIEAQDMYMSVDNTAPVVAIGEAQDSYMMPGDLVNPAEAEATRADDDGSDEEL